MPPKKASITNGDASDGASGGGKFTWDGPNDLKLLLLIQGRYAKLSSALPGTTKGSIRNRISTLRVKQRNLYQELGWEVPEGGAEDRLAKKGKKEGNGAGKGVKRERNGSEEVDGTPSKKRGKVGVKEEVNEEMEEMDMGFKVKDDGEEYEDHCARMTCGQC